jgi:hypothetical protein
LKRGIIARPGLRFLALLLCVCGFIQTAFAETADLVRAAKRIVFLGDSITYGGD